MERLPKNRKALERDIDACILGVDSFLNRSKSGKDMIDIQVAGYNKGYAFLNVALPDSMVKFFVAQMEIYHNLWRAVEFKVKYARAEKKAVDPVEIEKQEKRKADYEKDLFTVFDGLMSKGVPVREAVKQTRVALKDKGHPWADHHLVVSALSSAGRLRGTGFHDRITK